MENPEIIVGLDIGTTKVAAIVGKKNEYGKIEILGVSSAPSVGVMRGSIANIDETVKAIKTVIDDVSQKSNVEINEVHVGIAGQHIKSLQHSGSNMRTNKEDEIKQEEIDTLVESMYKLAMQPGEEIIHVIPQEYTIDEEPGIKKPIGMCGSFLQANFHIIVGHVSSAKNIHKCVNKAGLTVKELILEPLASAEAVLTDEEKEAGVVLVDMGGGTTDIAIFQDNIIRHTAVIPFGGNVITEDIKEGCTIIKRQAEALKLKFGSALASENSDDEIVSIPGLRGRHAKEISLKNLASIIQARVEEITERVYYEIVNSGYEKKLITGIVLTGGGALLKHMSQLTEFITGMDTRIGYPNEHLAKGVSEEIASPIYATGVGLVIKGFERYSKVKPVEIVQTAAKPPKKEKQSSWLKWGRTIEDYFNENIK
jgi:cell division protein FtsA